MAFIVEGTSAGGTTAVERECASTAYGTACEMRHAGYMDVGVTCPDGR